MLNFLQKFFDHNEREVARYQKVVEQINALEPKMQALTDDDLRAKTPEFKTRINETLEAEYARRGKTWETLTKDERRIVADAALDPILPEAFAVVRETGRRVLNMRHFDVQLIGGMVTHDGRIGELRTGEGKTLMATLPLYLNALMERGAHLVTPNDYLSKYGAIAMGPLYHFHGMSVGIIQGASPETGDQGGTFMYDPDYRDRDPRFEFARPLGRRAEAYACDVTYGTNNEYGFDYLRDNLAQRPADLSQRELYFAIVDEADSILIDEARTPLIISGPQDVSSDLYIRLDRIARTLEEERDYELEEKAKTAVFTEDGQTKVEKALGISNLTDPEHLSLMQHANAALRAYAVYKKDIDYVIKHNEAKNKNEVVIVDEFTGRLMFGRRWSDGLHQAVEAKEGVEIESESQTYATITFQNYFRLYTKLSGMTGTAKTEEEELRKVYALDVVTVPTNKPMIRKDHPDVIFKTREAKLRGITQELLRLYSTQQPVLVGTRNIETSERLSDRLTFQKLELLSMTLILRDKLDSVKGMDKQKYADYSSLLNTPIDKLSLPKLAPLAQELGVMSNPRQPENIAYLKQLLELGDEQNLYLEDALQHGIRHNVLNAKFHEKEAQIIAEAGRKGAVTIATNMAGRGVDIILGGTVTAADEADETANTGSIANGAETLTYRRGGSSLTRMQSLQDQEANRDHKARADEVRALGGLFILGTERHESRRIDNQLRGRAGRQGDPGASRFFISLEDELMRIFGDNSNKAMLATWPEEQHIDMPLFSTLIQKAQKKVEMHNFDIRKNVLEYDDVKNTQREVIYGQRRQVLEGVDLRSTMVNYLTEVVVGEMGVYVPESATTPEEWDLSGLWTALNHTFPLAFYIESAQGLEGMDRQHLQEKLIEIAQQAYSDKEASITPEIMRDVERYWTLMVLDKHWQEHLSNMEYLQEGIGWRGMSGTSPVVLFKKEAFDMFQALLGGLQDEVIRLIFHTQIEIQQPAPPPPPTQVQGMVFSDPMFAGATTLMGAVQGTPLMETGPVPLPNPYDAMETEPIETHPRPQSGVSGRKGGTTRPKRR